MKTNRRLGLFLLLLGAALGGGCAAGLNFMAEDELGREFFDRAVAGDISIEKPSFNLAVGEKLVYDVRWIGIPVGQVILENHGLEEVGGRDAYHLTCATVSNEFLSNFFNIEDTVHTWISREGGYPLRFEKQIQEGHYSKHQVIEYDHENLIATYYRKDKESEIKTMEIPAGVQDVFSILYWIRRQELAVGKELALDVNADNKNWVVEVEVKEKGVFDSRPLGKVKAFALVPSATHDGEPLKKGTMLVWMSTDRRRIPLAFKVRTPIFGSATAILAKAVLPPLPQRHFAFSNEGEDFLYRVYQADAWLKGLTQAPPLF